MIQVRFISQARLTRQLQHFSVQPYRHLVLVHYPMMQKLLKWPIYLADPVASTDTKHALKDILSVVNYH